MNAKELIEKLKGGALSKHADLYRDIPAETERYIKAIERFTELYAASARFRLFLTA